jgi:linoleoyl-CoA desaturase
MLKFRSSCFDAGRPSALSGLRGAAVFATCPMTTIEEINELRRDFARRGWYRTATGRIVRELLLHMAIALIGVATFLLCDHPTLRALGLLICTYGSIGVGTNSHTSSHYATSEKRWVNEALTYLGYPFFLGLSATLWWHKHVVLHHPAPNVIGVDGDADLSPWFAMTEAEVQASRGVRRFYYEHLQFRLFPLALAFNGFAMQLTGWRHLIGRLLDSQQRKRAHCGVGPIFETTS